MTEGLPNARSKLRLVLDYLPCEACLSQPVADQELLCTICHRLHREVDVTLVRRQTVLVERPTPVAAPVLLPPPAPLPPPAEVVVPAPGPEPVAASADVIPRDEPAPLRQDEFPPPEPLQAEPAAESFYAPPEEHAPEPAQERVFEPASEPATPPPAEEVPARVEETPAFAERAPPAEPEPVPEPRRSRGLAGLFRRKRRNAEEPAAAPTQAKDEREEDAGFDDVATFTGTPRSAARSEATDEEEPGFDDAFEYVGGGRAEATADAVPEVDSFDYAPPEKPAAKPAPPPVDELEDDFLYRPPGERAHDERPPPLRLPPEEPREPPEDLLPREEISVEPADGRNPWAPTEQDLFEDVLEPRRDPEPEPARAKERAEPEFEWPEDTLPPAPEPEPEEEIIETEIVDMEIVPDDEPIIETQVVDEEPPAPAPASTTTTAASEAREAPPAPLWAEPEPARAEPVPPAQDAAEEERKSRFASLFKRRKDKPKAAPAAAPAPAPAPVPAPALIGGQVITLRCGDCGTIFDVTDTGERPLHHACPGCGAEGLLRDEPPAPAPEPDPRAFAPPARDEDAVPPLRQENGPEAVVPASGAAAPADATTSDLYRLPAFNVSHAQTLARHRIETIGHLSGHDPHELSQRTAIDADLVAGWIHVADLVQEVGVPLHAALALVAAGIDGPKGLRAMDAEAILDRVAMFGDEGSLTIGDVRRWKRRA